MARCEIKYSFFASARTQALHFSGDRVKHLRRRGDASEKEGQSTDTNPLPPSSYFLLRPEWLLTLLCSLEMRQRWKKRGRRGRRLYPSPLDPPLGQWGIVPPRSKEEEEEDEEDEEEETGSRN